MNQRDAERRVDVRAAVRLRAVVFGAGAAGEVEMVTRDLSLGGTLCETPTALPLGRPVRLRLDLLDATGEPHPIVVEALALRVEGHGPYVVAFHFVGLTVRIQHALKAFLGRTLGGIA